MKTWFIAVLAAGVAVPVIAQTAQTPAAPAQAHRPMVETRAALGAHVQAMFARLDANRDGFVAKDEAQAAHRAFRGARGDRKSARGGGDGSARFDRMDANKDGAISRTEFDALRQQRVARRDTNGDGQPDARRGGKRGGMRLAGFGGRMFDMADANRDSRVSLEEATNAAFRHFDTIDANRDGTISTDERKSARERMRAQRQQS